jgi:plastocyanin
VSAARRVVLLACGGVLAAGSLAACGSGEEQPPAATTPPSTSSPATASGGASSPAVTSSSPTSAATPAARTVEITVTGDKVDPPPSQVDLAVGETLRIVVTSDHATELHAHGFEVETDVPAGQPTTVELTGSAPGVYEVELHHPDLLLLQVAVR